MLSKTWKSYYAIAGFGLFARASRLPISLAWDAFGEQNGVADLHEFRARVSKYRKAPLLPHEDPTIGCLLLTQPVFFTRERWIEQPRDWEKHAQQGITYDLAQGEGRRVWDACLSDAHIAHRTLHDGERFGSEQIIRPRLGQGIFRVAVTDAYGRACAVTGEHSLPVLEAAHIRPYSAEGTHEVSNGLLLRADLHKLFDRGYVTVNAEYRFRVSPQLRKGWGNGRSYYSLEGREIAVPRVAGERPDRGALEWHERNVFVA